MIELYYSPGACSFVPHVSLEVVRTSGGEGYEPRLVKLHKGEHRTPAFLAMNPNGQVPVLVVESRVGWSEWSSQPDSPGTSTPATPPAAR